MVWLRNLSEPSLSQTADSGERSACRNAQVSEPGTGAR